MPTSSCPWSEQREIRVPATGEVVVEAVGAGYWEVERAAELKGYELMEDVLKKFDKWYRSITCEGDCKKAGDECQKAFLWIGPPDVVKTAAKTVKGGRWKSTWQIELHAVGTLKIMCQCAPPRHGGTIVVR
jgi:hypothetical protein